MTRSLICRRSGGVKLLCEDPEVRGWEAIKGHGVNSYLETNERLVKDEDERQIDINTLPLRKIK